MPKIYANFDFEKSLFRQNYDYIIAIDEVGRGAIAGPVVIGATVVSAASENGIPPKIADSKMIPEKQRPEFERLSKEWVLGYAIGSVSASEVDLIGITAALAKAAVNAIQSLREQLPELEDKRTIVLLDGSHNWLSKSNLPFFVITRIKADMECASVSAASIIAKTYRDNLMISESVKNSNKYGWASNKGYGAPSHYAAIKEFGTDPIWHRLSWIKNKD
jgi:ribonuclease HII